MRFLSTRHPSRLLHLLQAPLALLFALILSPCRAATPPPAPAATPLPEFQSRSLGQIQPRQLTGISGLVASRKQPGIIWIHNDFRNERLLYAFDDKARLQAVYRIGGAQAVNWEDIALGPGPTPGVDYLYIADIGDNLRKRAEVTVYRLPEPAVPAGRDLTPRPLQAEALTFTYPDGKGHDAEALLVDPRSGDLLIVAKDLSWRAGLYCSPAPQAPGQRRTLQAAGSAPIGPMVTAGDVAPRGDRIILRTYTHASLWTRRPGETVAKALAAPPAQTLLLALEPQGEAIGFDARGAGFYTLSEGENPRLHFYEPSTAAQPRGGAPGKPPEKKP